MGQPARTPRLSWQEFVARFEAEKTKQQQRYCERFALWRECPVRRCRRDRTCRGKLNYCMVHAIHTMPRRDLSQAHDDIVKATPANIGAPERVARGCSPYDLCMANTTADAVAQYLRNQNYRLNFTRAQRDKIRANQHSVAAELNTRYILNIRFDFGSLTLDAELLHTSAATVIKTLLPIDATVVTWDGGLYFQIGTRVTRLSGARTEVALGEIAYCPDTGAIAIAFGREPMPSNPETGAGASLQRLGKSARRREDSGRGEGRHQGKDQRLAGPAEGRNQRTRAPSRPSMRSSAKQKSLKIWV
jgi:hypothetical protein